MNNFPPDRRASDGKQARCRKCINSWMKEHYRRNPAEHMLRRAKSRAQTKGFDCTIMLDDILPLPTHCPVFGMKLTCGNGQQDPNALSLDRIDNTLGYVPGNVVVMSYLANRLKNDGTAKQHERIAEWMQEQDPITRAADQVTIIQ